VGKVKGWAAAPTYQSGKGTDAIFQNHKTTKEKQGLRIGLKLAGR